MPAAVKVRRLQEDTTESDRSIQTVTVLPSDRAATPIHLEPLPSIKDDVTGIKESSASLNTAEPAVLEFAASTALENETSVKRTPVEHTNNSFAVSPPSFKNAAESVWIRGDLYGPPDPVSNLPHIKFTAVLNETPMEKRLREERQSVHDWNHKFWMLHNTRFAAEKEAFISRLTDKRPTADELSVFYKEFLNKYHRSHVEYNKELYRRNIRLLWPELAVAVHKVIRRIVRR